MKKIGAWMAGSCLLVLTIGFSCTSGANGDPEKTIEGVSGRLPKAEAETGIAKPLEATPPTCGNPTGEMTLRYGRLSYDDNVYAFTRTELKKGVRDFATHYTYTDAHKPLDNSLTQLTVASIFQLFDLIKNSGQFDATTDHSALKMHFGMENDRMVLVFEPVILKPMPYSTNEFTEQSLNRFFRGTGTGSYADADTATLLATYRRDVRVKHEDNAWAGFTWSDDFESGDTRYAVMPIQQILTMYCDNSSNHQANPDSLIRFQIAASDLYFEYRDNFKLHVIAYVEGHIQDGTHTDDFVGSGADFTQMCPPNCNVFYANYYDDRSVINNFIKNLRRRIIRH